MIENKKILETINFVCTEDDKEKRLDVFIQESMEDATRNYVQKLIESGYVLIENNNKSKLKCGLKLKGNEKIIVNIPEDEEIDLTPENIPLNIIYEDDDIVVINKTANMVVHPAFGNYTGTLVNAILFHVKNLSSINGIIRPGIVHRLDKDTSGVIVVAKNNDAHLKLSQMFKDKTLTKTYVCICKGNFKEKKGRVENLIGRSARDRKKMAVVEDDGRNAITNYEVIAEVKGFSLVKVQIETGRTHQIRVHMKVLNHPILGDETYGTITKEDEKLGATRQMLHAYSLELKHPRTGEEKKFVGELPEDFKKVLEKLSLEFNLK